MKKRFFIIFFFLLLCASLVGCATHSVDSSQNSQIDSIASFREAEIPVLKVLIDLSIGDDSHTACEEMKTFFENNVDGCGDDFLIEVESLPTISDPEKRNPTVMGMHMEMLSDGPDVFIMRNFSNSLGIYTDLKNFFPYPTSAMKQRLFLPLDKYISNDPNWENLFSVIMEAGRQKDSQQIVPLSYSMKVTLVDVNKYTLTEEFPLTCYQMLDGNDPVIRYSASSGLDMLGLLAHYDKEELSFSEDELFALVHKFKEGKQNESKDDINSFNIINDVSVGPLNDAILSSDDTTNYWMIPSYNRNGGVTAQIESYAAINRNTKYPNEAYAVIKSLVSQEGQQNELVTCLKLPVLMSVASENSIAASEWSLDKWEFDQLVALQSQINAVEFITPLSTEVERLFHECFHIDDEAALKSTVHDSYTRMQMMLAES